MISGSCSKSFAEIKAGQSQFSFMALIDFVDPLIGTDSHHGFSTGNCLPLCALPFGMAAWSPQTAEGSWFFDRRQRKLQGIRSTHQPSPWIGDYGHFVICPQVGEIKLSPHQRSSAFLVEKSIVKPHKLEFDFLRYRTRIELAPTKRCAHLRFHFPDDDIARIILEGCTGDGEFSVDVENRTVCGFTRGNSGGCPAEFACYFFAVISTKIHSAGVFDQSNQPSFESSMQGPEAGGFVEFDRPTEAVEMKIATSFISVHQAHINLERELGDASFDETVERSERVWEDTLARITIETPDFAAKTLFYTSFYRTQLFPRFIQEENSTGAEVHWSPYDGKVHDGLMVADNGFWDTYRTVYPLFALLDPPRLSQILQGWVNTLGEGGWFPQWASPGYRACMVGTHIDAVIADAVSRGVVDFDVATAYGGLRKHAFTPGDEQGSFGRIGIERYLELGYVPCDEHDSSVARSLDYAYDDWCIAQVANYLGKETEAQELMARSQSYRHLWDQEVGFMRGKLANGKFSEPFDPHTWGDPFVEGGPWQGSWAVQHDVGGLSQLMGGNDRMIEKLGEMLTGRPDFNVGSYGFEIHEMTEMACDEFGQYAHSNQPVHHVLYLFAELGRPDLTRSWVDKVLRKMYTTARFPGDEDNGEMSAWYMLSALGIFPFAPGRGDWTLGALLFDRAEIRLSDEKKLELRSIGIRREDGKLKHVLVDGNVWKGHSITHKQLLKASKIEFVWET